MTTTNKCFACDRKLGSVPKSADTRDGQVVYVGVDCYRKIVAAGEAGYQPPKGGPRLFDVKRGDGYETCLGCGSENLFTAPRDADGYADGSSEKWSAICSNCGMDQDSKEKVKKDGKRR